jgi:hypothetical protein
VRFEVDGTPQSGVVFTVPAQSWIVGLGLPVLAWFEKDLGWVPSLDLRASSARTPLV